MSVRVEESRIEVEEEEVEEEVVTDVEVVPEVLSELLTEVEVEIEVEIEVVEAGSNKLYSFSTLLKCRISALAVFGPIPFTPGILSYEKNSLRKK